MGDHAQHKNTGGVCEVGEGEGGPGGAHTASSPRDLQQLHYQYTPASCSACPPRFAFPSPPPRAVAWLFSTPPSLCHSQRRPQGSQAPLRHQSDVQATVGQEDSSLTCTQRTRGTQQRIPPPPPHLMHDTYQQQLQRGVAPCGVSGGWPQCCGTVQRCRSHSWQPRTAEWTCTRRATGTAGPAAAALGRPRQETCAEG